MKEALLVTGATYDDFSDDKMKERDGQEEKDDEPRKEKRAKFERQFTGRQIPDGYYDSDDAKYGSVHGSSSEDDNMDEPQASTKASMQQPKTPPREKLRDAEKEEECMELDSDNEQRKAAFQDSP